MSRPSDLEILRMIAAASPIQKARLRGTASKVGHVGYLQVRKHLSQAVIDVHGMFSIYIEDPKRIRWRWCKINEDDLDGSRTYMLELKSVHGTYMFLDEWLVVEDGVNLYELAWQIVDSEAGYTTEFAPSPASHKMEYQDKEDELREMFELDPLRRREPINHKPSPI